MGRLQPQGQLNFLAIALTRALSHSAAVWATHSVAIIVRATLALHWLKVWSILDHPRMSSRSSGAGDQTDESSGEHDHVSDPYPGDKRKNVGVQHGFSSVVGRSSKADIQVFVQTPSYADLGGRLLVGKVQPAFGQEGTCVA